MKLMKWLLGGAGVVYMGMGALLYRNVLKPNTFTHKESYEFDMNQGSYTPEMIESLPKEIVNIKSTMGYNIFAYWLPYEESNKTVILVHGITSTIYGALKYYELYRNMGYNILTYDHRNHGKSGGTQTTLGFHEKKDLETCVNWVKERVGEESIIGTHGESMGGATVIQHAAAYDSIDFVVSDCPFADLSRELRDVSKRDHKVPMWRALPVASFISKLTGNGWYQEVSPIRVIGNVEVPLMIIHGDSDTYITPDHARDLYDAKIKGVRKLFFAKGADHALSIIKDKENYTREVKEFLREIAIEA